MERENTKKIGKIIGIIVILAILITGSIMIAIAKFHFTLDYTAHQRIEIFIGKATSGKEIKEITKEVFGNQKTIIQEIEVFHDMISISVKEVTEEQKDSLLQKLNEKYSLELTKDKDMSIYPMPAYRGRDMIKRYSVPIVISAILIFVYIGIRYQKLGIIKNLAKIVGLVILIEALYLCIIAITRIPISQYTIPVGLVLGIFTVFVFIMKKETQLEKQEKQDNKSKS